MNDYNLRIDKINLPDIIKHRDKDFFICSIRQKFIQSKPEENLRQQIVTYLTDILGYPSNYIDIEVPMSYFSPRKTSRADIIVYDRLFTLPEAKPFILIECKASGINKLLDDFRHHKQVNDYDEIVNAKIVMLTNGQEAFIREKKTERQLERLPTYSEFKKNKEFKYIETQPRLWVRTPYKQRFDKKTQSFFVKENFISKTTDSKLFPYVIQLMDLFYDNKSLFKPQALGQFELIKDCGLRRANYGYAFGAGLIGDYRFFLFKLKDGNHTKVSYSIYHQNDWGTYLMIAVDDRQGHSIELRFDKYIRISNTNLYDIWHNGSLTVGKKGRLKNSEVIDYLKINAPVLVKDDKVVLGTLDLSKDLKFDQPEVKDFVLRTSVYAILREQIRHDRQ